MDIVYRHVVIVYCHIVIVYHRIDVVTCSSSRSATFRATVWTSEINTHVSVYVGRYPVFSDEIVELGVVQDMIFYNSKANDAAAKIDLIMM